MTLCRNSCTTSNRTFYMVEDYTAEITNMLELCWLDHYVFKTTASCDGIPEIFHTGFTK